MTIFLTLYFHLFCYTRHWSLGFTYLLYNTFTKPHQQLTSTPRSQSHLPPLAQNGHPQRQTRPPTPPRHPGHLPPRSRTQHRRRRRDLPPFASFGHDSYGLVGGVGAFGSLSGEKAGWIACGFVSGVAFVDVFGCFVGDDFFFLSVLGGFGVGFWGLDCFLSGFSVFT